MIDPNQVREAFRNIFGDAGRRGDQPRLFRAPGRVNLIGEHTDYNDGFVLPVAIDRDTICAVRPRDDNEVHVHSLNVRETRTFDLSSEWAASGSPMIRPTMLTKNKSEDQWTNYIEGVARVLIDRGIEVRGCDMLVYSDVPDGAGLSSSAALEISAGLAFMSLVPSGTIMAPVELALAAQQAEHEYVGTMCGIMDQYVSVLGKAGHALLIDCRTLQSQQIPFGVEGRGSIPAIVVCDTRVKHSLASSEYNKRRAECERATEIFQEHLATVRALRDISMQDFDDLSPTFDKVPDGDVLRKRSRHVISEIQRTLEAAEALRQGDWTRMGQLMYASHASLRDDYEVSSPELDLLVEIAHSHKGTIGARMTGGGFGGSTVNFVEQNQVEDFERTIREEYAGRFNREAGVFVVRPVDGAGEVS